MSFTGGKCNMKPYKSQSELPENWRVHPRAVVLITVASAIEYSGILVDSDSRGVVIVDEATPDYTTFIPYSNIFSIIYPNKSRLNAIRNECTKLEE